MQTVVIKIIVGSAGGPEGAVRASSPPDEVVEAGKSFGVVFQPMHPGVEDADLASYFYALVESRDLAEKVASALRSCSGVDAAYFKPAGEAPT
jgi:hypothetical protein